MANQKTKNYLRDITKAENWLADYIANATKGVSDKDTDLLRHKIKQAEIALFNNKVKGVPRNVKRILHKRDKQNPLLTIGRRVYNIPANLEANVTKASRDLRIRSNQARLATGRKPLYIGDKAPQTVTRPVNPSYSFDRTSLTTLVNDLVKERYAVEDLIGGRGVDHVDYKLLSRIGITNFNPTDGINPLYDDNYDVITHSKRIKSERDAYEKLYKGNNDYGNAFWKTGSNYKSVFNKESPNYKVNLSTSGKALSIKERQAYDPDRTADASLGDVYWSGRGSGRSFRQANDDTRALLIDEFGADATQVKYLDSDVLSRFRISGYLAKTDSNLSLLNDGGRPINLKLNRNSLTTSGGAIFEGSPPTKTTSKQTQQTKGFLGITRIKDPNTGKNVPLHETFSDPL